MNNNKIPAILDDQTLRDVSGMTPPCQICNTVYLGSFRDKSYLVCDCHKYTCATASFPEMSAEWSNIRGMTMQRYDQFKQRQLDELEEAEL